MTDPVMRGVVVDVANRSYRFEEISIGGNVLGVIDYGVVLHLDKYRSYEADAFSPRNVLVMGCGPFAGARIFGGHRMVFVFRSPETGGLHVSTMGGACYQFIRTGLRFLVIEGWSEEPLVITLRGKRGGSVIVDFYELGWERVWSLWRNYNGAKGTLGLARYLYDKVISDWEGVSRVAVTGPAAARTIYGGIFSYMIEGDGLSPVVDSASRGGAGSVMTRGHGVVGVVFGGEHDASREMSVINRVVDEATRQVFGEDYVSVVRRATTKYRFDEKLGTGGTFGVNYIHYRDMLPFFGYNTVYLSKVARLQLLEQILENLWRPVQKEVFESNDKPWKTCGEPCIAVCKKIWRGVKLDYEPSNALGPFIGVARAEHVAELVKLADELGIDAIEAGHIIAWVFDAVHRGMLSPSEVGLSQRPFFDPISYSVEQSAINAKLAIELLNGLVEHRTEVLRYVAEEGLRAAAKKLNEVMSFRTRMYGLGYHDLLVYAAYGDKWYMTPNLYWAPGLIAPLVVPGRYWTYYSPGIPRDPREFGEIIVARMVNEYLVDNAGTCRFYRKWSEKVLDKLYEALIGEPVDLGKHARRVLGRLAKYRALAGSLPVPWESRKSIDMIAALAAELGDTELAEKIHHSYKEYWDKLYKHIWEWLGLVQA